MEDLISHLEAERLRVLSSYELLDTPTEQDFDDLTRLAARIFKVPIVAISLIDRDRQWFKSAVGLPVRETERCISFCTHTIQQSTPFIVQDALQDQRFEKNPLVIGEPHIRFYAGIPLINPDGVALGSFCLIDREPRVLSDDQIELLKALSRHAMSLFELRLQHSRLRRSREERDLIAGQLEQYSSHLADAQRIARIGSWELLVDEDHLQWSDEAKRIAGLDVSESSLQIEDFMGMLHPQDRPMVRRAYEGLINGGNTVDIEYRLIRPDGEMRYIHVLAEPKAEQPGMQRKVWGTAQDITERKLAELELQRLNRSLKMLTACSEALVHANDEKQLLDEICQHAITIGGYRMAWVGYAQDDARKSIVPMAHAGLTCDEEYLALLKLSWSADEPAGQGPGGRAVRSGTPVVSEDIARDSTFWWADEAQGYGFRSAICLPLRNYQHTFGLLVMYSSEARSLPAEEISLLQQMADDLAFGIFSIRARDEQRKLQSAVLQVSNSVAASFGHAFFESLAFSVAEVLNAQASVVAKLLPGKPQRAQTIAAIIDGRAVENFDYLLEHTPCRNLIHEEDCLVPAEAAVLYPDSPALVELQIQAYVGTRLVNASGKPIGMLFVLFREPLQQSDFVTSTLRVFATRAAAEIERQEADKRISEQASLLDKAQDAIIVRDMEGQIQFWNKSAERLYGWTAEEVVGRRGEGLFNVEAQGYKDVMLKITELGEWVGELVEQRKDGSSIVIEGRWTLVRDDKGRPQSILAIKTDITQRKSAEKAIQHLAFYDALTGLPNRQLLMDRLGKALAHSARNRHCGALLFIDLDDFKTLNDTLGHDLGDLLLRQVAQRMISCVRRSDSVGRLGGDEFVVMLDELNENLAEAANEARNVGEKIIAAFMTPFRLKEYEHHTTPSIGVAMFNEQIDDVDALLKRADLAMYQAKASGKNTLRFFDPEMQAIVTARARLEASLRQALQQSQLLLYYQPQVDSDANVIGVETLLRWQHPDRGIVPPLEFIPLAEETGMIIPIGWWVLRNACEQLARWAAMPQLAHLTLSVNVSARQFRHADFVAQVMEILRQTGADPGKLKLELTESMVVANVEDVIAKMKKLKAAGVGFSLDDFGTGYSSLAYLKRMPLGQLKIDQTFVREVLTNSNDAAIASIIISLAQSLGLGVIAEGVENEAQREFLLGKGCRFYQGYLFSKPVPLDQFEAFVLDDADNWQKSASCASIDVSEQSKKAKT
jgi:diguanylate cyclase (GGDEF)-like protein/PAS domain S-box-containing protein